MFIECNFPIYVDTSEEYLNNLVQRLNFLRNLGWQGVALCITIDNSNINKLNEIIQITFPQIINYINKELESTKWNNTLSFTLPLRKKENLNQEDFKIYKRITFHQELHKKISSINFEDELYHSIDILSINISEKIIGTETLITLLNTICTKSHIDLLSFILPNSFDFSVIRKIRNKFGEALRRNISFEFCYGDLNISQTNWINLLTTLIKLYKGKQFILSNGSFNLSPKLINNKTIEQKIPSLLKAPHDAANIVGILGLSYVFGKSLITTNPLFVLKHSEMRKSIKGVIKVTDITNDNNTMDINE
ncbi:hypothetical protein ABK040_003678 [Willaertia magna]